jgi:hypothetical protein
MGLEMVLVLPLYIAASLAWYVLAYWAFGWFGVFALPILAFGIAVTAGTFD